jgi:putative ATP-dependent endonuclease of the OLD family
MKIRQIEIENYRTIEKTTIGFPTYYTAICGKNNSGKSNIVKALRYILGNHRDYVERFNIAIKNDFPIWKTNVKDDDKIIGIKITFNLFQDYDSNLIKYIQTFGFENKDCSPEKKHIGDFEINLSIQIHSDPKKTKGIVSVNNQIIDDYRSNEIISKIWNSQMLIFHNSTQVNSRIRRNSHGNVGNFNINSKTKIEEKAQSLQKELKNVVESYKKELSSLLGRLEEKYDVSLSFTGLDFNIESIPFEINLGEKNFEIPLEDWGSGTKNRTLIMQSIFNAKKQLENEEDKSKGTPIVIIEEPESFLHPSAQAEFGRILQDIAEEFKIQVIATTHSPYLLSHFNPKSNILVKRQVDKGKFRESYIESIEGDNWREPYELALGMVGPEFETLKNAFFTQSNNILFVEGAIDKEYFEMLKDASHGENRLMFSGEIYSYDGFGFLNNAILLKFIKNRFSQIAVTLDLDAIQVVGKNLECAGFVKNKDYFVIGKNEPGKRFIEGLLPDSIINKVNAENIAFVRALSSDNKEEVKDAKSKLKQLYLKEFKDIAQPTEEYFSEFYKVTKLINKTLKK